MEEIIIKRRIYGAVAVVGVLSVSTRFIAFLFRIYLSRALGAEAVGLYQICLSVFFMLAAVSSTGIPLILSRRIAADDVKGNNSSSILTAGLILSVGISLIITITIYLFKGQISAIFKDERAMPLFLIMLPALISTSIYCIFRSFFLGRMKYAVYGITELGEEILRAALGICLATGLIARISGVTGIAIAFVISDFACAIALATIYFSKNKLKKPSDFKKLSASAAPITLTRVFGSMVGSLIAVLIPVKLIATGMTAYEATAAYGRVTGMALPLIMAPTTITGALAVVLVPEVSSSALNSRELNSKISGSMFFTFLISAAFCALYMPLGEEITMLLFDDAVAGEFVSNAALLIFPISFNQITGTVLNSLNMEKQTFIHYVVGTIFLVLSLIFLPAFIGIYAIAAGFGICFTVTTTLNLRLLKKTATFDSDLKRLMLTAAAVIPCCFITYTLKILLNGSLSLFLLLSICAVLDGLIFVALLWCLKVIDVKTFYLATKLHLKLKKSST